MLRIHSFLQSIYGYLKLSLNKKMYRTCAVLCLTGTTVLTVIPLSSQNFGGGGKSHSIVYQSEGAVTEESEDEEIEADTKAKVQTTDHSVEIEAQHIPLQGIMRERITSEKAQNQLSVVTLGQEETTTNSEENTQSNGMTSSEVQTETTAEPETMAQVQEETTANSRETLYTEAGGGAVYNSYMDAVSLTEEEQSYLLHLVAAEAGGCDMVGQILVANVVLNRMESDSFPDSAASVIFQKNQFSPTMNGAIWSSTITDSVKEAVERALEGEDYSQGATFFSARARLDADSMSWFDNNLNWLFAHDGHEFYSLR